MNTDNLIATEAEKGNKLAILLYLNNNTQNSYNSQCPIKNSLELIKLN